MIRSKWRRDILAYYFINILIIAINSYNIEDNQIII